MKRNIYASFFLMALQFVAFAKGDDVLERRPELLKLMFNNWALNVNGVKGHEAYLSSAGDFNKKEKEALKSYMREVSTDASKKTMKEITLHAHDQIDKKDGIIAQLKAAGTLSTPASVLHFRAELTKLREKLNTVLKDRNKDDPAFREFLSEEEKQELVKKADELSKDESEEEKARRSPVIEVTPSDKLWNSILHNPHTEVVLRMLEGTDVLLSSLETYSEQVFRDKPLREKYPFSEGGPYDGTPFPVKNPHSPLRIKEEK